MVWVGESSEAVEKSRSSRFLKSFTVFGAEIVGAVYRRREWTLTWPLNLGKEKRLVLLFGVCDNGEGYGGVCL
jgi:hypothetical protein